MFFQDASAFQGLATLLIGLAYASIAIHYFTKLETRLSIVHQGHKAFIKLINHEIEKTYCFAW